MRHMVQTLGTPPPFLLKEAGRPGHSDDQPRHEPAIPGPLQDRDLLPALPPQMGSQEGRLGSGLPVAGSSLPVPQGYRLWPAREDSSV